MKLIIYNTVSSNWYYCTDINAWRIDGTKSTNLGLHKRFCAIFRYIFSELINSPYKMAENRLGTANSGYVFFWPPSWKIFPTAVDVFYRWTKIHLSLKLEVPWNKLLARLLEQNPPKRGRLTVEAPHRHGTETKIIWCLRGGFSHAPWWCSCCRAPLVPLMAWLGSFFSSTLFKSIHMISPAYTMRTIIPFHVYTWPQTRGVYYFSQSVLANFVHISWRSIYTHGVSWPFSREGSRYKTVSSCPCNISSPRWIVVDPSYMPTAMG